MRRAIARCGERPDSALFDGQKFQIGIDPVGGFQEFMYLAQQAVGEGESGHGDED